MNTAMQNRGNTQHTQELSNRCWHVAGAARIGGGKAETARTGWTFPANSTRELADALASSGTALPRWDSGDFRRAGDIAKFFILGALLAFLDAGKEGGKKIALLDSGHNGCLKDDLAYWRDYVQFGKTLGRGHLFVGTLPTTALCEAAIALGLTGGGCYLDAPAGNPALMEEIDTMLEDAEMEAVLLFLRDEAEENGSGALRSFYLERGGKGDLSSGAISMPSWADPEKPFSGARGS